MRLALDRAIGLARSRSQLPVVWVQRVERLGELTTPRAAGKTYIAALGGAMLAKATDTRVDSLTQDEAVSPRGYSLRNAAEFLAKNNHGRYHLGVQGPNPMNNRPFIGGPARIDEFVKIHPRAQPAFLLFRDCLVEVNRMASEQALMALAAFLRVRMAVADSERSARAVALSLGGARIAELIRAIEIFVAEDAEGGKRGQALAAAIMDCVFEKVDLRSINDPGSADVRVIDGPRTLLPIEVKQKPVDEQTGIDLARSAYEMGASKALLVVLAPRHQPLDREQVRRGALEAHGVLVEVCESARELIGTVAVFAGVLIETIEQVLPGAYASRLSEHDASEHGQRRWRELVDARRG